MATGSAIPLTPGIDPKDLATLELPKVLARLAGYCAFSASQQLAIELSPTTALEFAQVRQRQTTQARRLLSAQSSLSIGGARDIRANVVAAERGAVLEPQDLLDIKATLESSRTLRRVFRRDGPSYPDLSELAAGLVEDTGLIEAISRTVDDRGNVLDSASPKLRTLRRELRAAQARLARKLDRMVGDPKFAPMLQEPIVTQRQGRSVIPLRAEYKGRLPAVVHDQSASGATLFVEPLEAVELNNAVRELELQERDEVRRVLGELSAAIGVQREAIEAAVEALAALDLAFAKAHFADELKANEPVLKRSGAPGSRLSLRAARHPLLDPASLVPIDLTLDPDVRAIVITGPNTGGKTVSLKTAGLLAAMGQCGLHLPTADGSELELFQGIFADIGDEQSIEQSLSTFSAHISNIVRILRVADAHSLVLLDELGAGTDPGEGAALARALMVEFLDRGCVSLVATHFPELKAFAHLTPGVQNASVEFDLESLQPTYRLTVGLPGRSNALAIAERLGLRKRIVEAARTQVSPDDLQTDSLLEEIRRQRDAAVRAGTEAERASQEARLLRDELRRRMDGIDEERMEILGQARRQTGLELEGLKRELAELRRLLAAASEPLQAADDIKEELQRLEHNFEAAQARPETILSGLEPEPHDLDVGDRVRVRSIGAEGVVTALEGGQAEVQLGRLRIKAEAEDLVPLTGVSAGDPPMSEGRLPPPAARPPVELYVRGRTVDEALDQLERSLDAAYLAGAPYLRVVHGKGSGRLRQAIREALQGSNYVASFESGAPAEGGEGVTVVWLAQD